MKRRLLLVLSYREADGDNRFVSQCEITADVGEIEPPAPEEMQRIMYAAKMELARGRRDGRRGRTWPFVYKGWTLTRVLGAKLGCRGGAARKYGIIAKAPWGEDYIFKPYYYGGADPKIVMKMIDGAEGQRVKAESAEPSPKG